MDLRIVDWRRDDVYLFKSTLPTAHPKFHSISESQMEKSASFETHCCFGETSEAQSAARWVPCWLLQCCFHAPSRPGMKASQVGHMAERKSKPQSHQSATTTRSPRQDPFCGQWTQRSPVTLFVYVMVIWGKMHKPEDIQTARLLSLATFVPHSSWPLVCIAALRPVVLGPSS